MYVCAYIYPIGTVGEEGRREREREERKRLIGPLREEDADRALKGGLKPRVRKFGRKTISVIPTGANGNFGHTGDIPDATPPR